MKLLAAIDTLEVGGAETSLVEILGRLSGRGHRVAVWSLYPGESLRGPFEEAGVEVRALRLPGRYALRRAARELTAGVRTGRPDLLFATLFRAGLAARIAARRTGVPLVDSLVNDSYAPRRFQALGPAGDLKLRAVRAVDRATAERVDRFLAVSATVADAGRRDLGIPVERISVVYRGRDPERFRPGGPDETAESKALRASLGAGPGDPLLLVTSRLLARKGHRELLGAMPEIVRARPGTRLVVAGDGPERGALEELAGRLGIEDAVRFLGTRDDVPRLLRAADLFVFPSHFEGLPGSLVEAMLSALPVAAADTAHNLECLGDRSHAELFAVGDPAALARAVLALLDDAARAAEMARRARSEALGRFAVEAVVDRYERLFEEVAATGGRP